MPSEGTALQKFHCPVAGFQQIINGKYKLRILWDLQSGPLRYGEIRRRLSETTGARNITARVLSRELKTLVKMGLLQRRELQSRPLKVQYGLTPEGRTLVPVIAVMHKWGVEHLVRRSVLLKMGIPPRESD